MTQAEHPQTVEGRPIPCAYCGADTEPNERIWSLGDGGEPFCSNECHEAWTDETEDDDR